MARTVAIAGTFALAASLAARSDAAHAAAHQACLQVLNACFSCRPAWVCHKSHTLFVALCQLSKYRPVLQ